jgi:porin
MRVDRLYLCRRCGDRASFCGIGGAVLPVIVLAVAIVVPSWAVAQAQDGAPEVVAPREEPAGVIEPSISSSVPALGDFKHALLDSGVNFQLDYIQDTFGNATGGVQQGATYESALYMKVDADLAKLAGLTGTTFRVNAYQIQGAGLSIHNIYNYSTISSIEARPATRLFELWVEQKLFPDTASIRIGQLTADNQFCLSEFSWLYIDATFGWPNSLSANLPGGGPDYPLATPGAQSLSRRIGAARLQRHVGGAQCYALPQRRGPM